MTSARPNSNEVFFDGITRTPAENVVGAPGQGWKVAMALLGFERGASTLGQQIGFESEFKEILAAAKANGAAKDPIIRQKLAQAWIELQVVRLNALTNLNEGTARPGLAAINKLTWATWHRNAGELAMEVMGADAEICAEPPYALTRIQNRFLFSPLRYDLWRDERDSAQYHCRARAGPVTRTLAREPRRPYGY